MSTSEFAWDIDDFPPMPRCPVVRWKFKPLQIHTVLPAPRHWPAEGPVCWLPRVPDSDDDIQF